MREEIIGLMSRLGFVAESHPDRGTWDAAERKRGNALGSVDAIEEPNYFCYNGYREGPVFSPPPPGGKKQIAHPQHGTPGVSGWTINTPEQEAKYNYWKSKDIKMDHNRVQEVSVVLNQSEDDRNPCAFNPSASTIEKMDRYTTKASIGSTVDQGDLESGHRDEWAVRGFGNDWSTRIAKRDNSRYGKRPVYMAFIQDHLLLNKSLAEIEAEMREDNRNRVDRNIVRDTRPNHACRPT
jgi:hypothetical protein